MAEPQIDTFYADLAFLETEGTIATKVKAAVWAYTHLSNADPMSLINIREWLVREGFTVVRRG